jgi:hypothetical protein
MRKLSMDFQPHFMAGLCLRKKDKSHWDCTVRPSVVPLKRPACSICSFVAETDRRLIHADEVWSFPESTKVILTDVRPLCVYCHEAKDYADLLRRIMRGKARASMTSTVMEHYCGLNACSRDDFDEDVAAAFKMMNELERRYFYGIKGSPEVDYGRWDRPADTPQLTVAEKRQIKVAFADRDEPITVGLKSLKTYASAVRWLQSVTLKERSEIIAAIIQFVEEGLDDDEIIKERDEEIEFRA